MKLSRPLILILLAGLLFICLLAALASGALSIPLSRMFALLFSATSQEETLWRNILLDLRLPRALLAILAGGGLACAGTVMQALFRNPLAEPGLSGVISGSALGAVCALAVGGMVWLVWSSAFAGALLATTLAWQLGRRYPGAAGLLLAGIAINAICASLIGLVSVFANDQLLRNITFWNTGNLAYADWHTLRWLAPLLLTLILLAWREWRALNALLLGEREAQHLGFDLTRLRRRLFILCALLVAPLTAICGGIGFIGLIAPHIARMLLGAHHRWLLPGAILSGAILLTLADGAARIALPPAELPAGLITSLLGGPFFLWLLSRRRS